MDFPANYAEVAKQIKLVISSDGFITCYNVIVVVIYSSFRLSLETPLIVVTIAVLFLYFPAKCVRPSV